MAIFELNKMYNFTTKAPAILGGSYKNMKVDAIVNAREAVKYADIMTLHEQVKTATALSVSAADATYIIFRTLTGETKLMALEYIHTDTVREVKTVNIKVELENYNTEDISIIDNRLRELGYKNFKITTY